MTMCNPCGFERPETDFYASRPDMKICKACFRAMTAAGKKRRQEQYAGATVTEKKCLRCEQVKPASEFSMLRARKDGLRSECKTCRADERQIERYGIDLAEFDRLNVEQGGKCKICGGVPPGGKRLHVDHCHSSGAVRGLLCFRCNVGLGYFRDDPALLRAAASYL